MTIQATVAFAENNFIATLSDGRQIQRGDFREMAYALFYAGVPAHAVEYEWRAGQRMITAGQQVALRAETGRLEREIGRQPISA